MSRSRITYSSLLLLSSLLFAACGGATPIPHASTPAETPTRAPTPTPTVVPTTAPQPTEPAAEDEPAQIVGTAEITFILFESYVSEPFVLLEDQAGFVQRDFEFVIPPAGQVVGPLFKTGEDTWEYVLNLPAVPVGTFVDVDNDDEAGAGVQVFAVTVQANIVDDPFLGEDEFEGWSTVWSSARIDSENEDEVNGGTLIVWAPDDQQQFPTGFGEDGLLFTDDDPIGPAPAGYTIVNLDETPFEFYKEAQPNITLYEGDVAVNDYSDMSYTEAFDALWGKASAEYPFTEMKGIDWQALYDEFAPRVAEAEAEADYAAWYLAMRDFSWAIPDGHVGVQGDDGGLFQIENAGGLGLAVIGLDDGRVIAHIVIEDGPAAEAGIELGAEILEFNGQPITEALDAVVPWASPFSTEHSKRIQQFRYLLRNKLGEAAAITWLNPGATESQTATLEFVPERETFAATSIYAGFDANALPVEYEILPESGYGYIRLWSLSDDLNLIVRLFERAVSVFTENDVPGIIIDLRQNGGGNPMGAELASYFAAEEVELSRDYYYSEKTGDFETYRPPRTLEPDPELHYGGQVAVLVGPACASACEDVAWVLSQLDQVRVFGHYPSNGIFGEVGRGQYELPDGLSFQIPTGMDVDLDGNVIIEGTGVVPDVFVPLTEETVLAESDVILDFAIEALEQPLGAGIVPSGPPQLGSVAESEAALQAQTPFLDSLAREEYEETAQAGETYTYTVPMAESRDVLWLYAWCTTTAEQLAQNWDNINLTFTLDGEDIPLSDFALLEGTFGAQECRAHYALLNDWPRGEHNLTVEVTFAAAINDGSDDYPAGTHVYEYRVFANK